MGSKLDQIVKGAPPPGTSVPTVISKPDPSTPTPIEASWKPSPSRSPPPLLPSDHLAALPSSPAQIYLNLLILEASLRSQFLTLRHRRRQNTFFLFLLTLWIAGFAYLLFLRPREDGRGIGGSVYWVVEMAEKVALMGGAVTAVLIWGTGQWERGVRWPRRWVAVANRGLRSVNAKIVVVKGPWWKEMLGHLSFLFPYSSLFPSSGDSYRYVDLMTTGGTHGGMDRGGEEEEFSREEDLSPGGDYIKLLLLPKPFSPDFREKWEIYRLEYWEKENERRARLRHSLRKRQREWARKNGGGGWFWRLGLHRVAQAGGAAAAAKGDLEKSHHKQHQQHHVDKEGSGGGKRRQHAASRSESHSRTASRSSTPSTLDPDEFRPSLAGKTRRGSSTTASAIASERRKKGVRGSVAVSVDGGGGHVGKLTQLSGRGA